MSGKNLEYWLSSSRGERGVDYQKAAQITWWSILQGLAVAALAEKIPQILTVVSQEGRWYLLLYVVTTFLVVTNTWVQMAWAILVLRWKISLLHTTVLLLAGIAAYLTCLYVDSPWYWILSLLFLLVSAIAVYLYNLQKRTTLSLSAAITKRTLTVYFMFLVLVAGASIHMNMRQDAVNLTFWGIIFLVLAVVSCVLQEHNMRQEGIVRGVPGFESEHRLSDVPGAQAE